MKGSNCVEMSARVGLKKNILGFTKFFEYIKRQLHHWNVTMIYENVSEHTSNPPELLFKKVFCIHAANLWEKRRESITTLSHCCSPVNLQYIYRIHFLKNTSGWLLVRTPISQATQYLLRENPVQDDITAIKQGTKKFRSSRAIVFNQRISTIISKKVNN